MEHSRAVGHTAAVDLDRYVHDLELSCRETPGVTSLVVYGSTAASAADRRDQWSDVDFTVFLAPSHQDELTARWRFLPHRERLVLQARDRGAGGMALYEDGTLLEFGVGLPWLLRDPERQVLVDGGDLRFADPDPLPDPGDEIGVFVGKLFIGMARLRRGERVAANAHIRCYALSPLCEVLRQRLAPDAPRSPFDPLRRLESALPGIAARLATLLDDDLEACARGMLDLSRELLEPGWGGYPSRAADVVAQRLGWTRPA